MRGEWQCWPRIIPTQRAALLYTVKRTSLCLLESPRHTRCSPVRGAPHHGWMCVLCFPARSMPTIPARQPTRETYSLPGARLPLIIRSNCLGLCAFLPRRQLLQHHELFTCVPARAHACVCVSHAVCDCLSLTPRSCVSGCSSSVHITMATSGGASAQQISPLVSVGAAELLPRSATELSANYRDTDGGSVVRLSAMLGQSEPLHDQGIVKPLYLAAIYAVDAASPDGQMAAP